ncbi:type IV toxin-antitoxin system AbiEi family antitoxin domain-containing protein [candidate division KSB1 bacterium]|nr:type IV toxin-antitoxin system AbiEi family antitoxin domain-containing protein [candidate division KSB1 bacterium]
MKKNITKLGARENEFLLTFSGTDRNIFTLREAAGFWGSSHNARIAIHRLIAKGWLAPIEKGKYLIIPLEAGPSRKWTEDAAIIASALVQPAVIAYWSAIRHWNWTEQIPRIVYVQTTKRKFTPRRTIFGVQYDIITVNKKKLFGMVKEWRNGKSFYVTDREKTLIDCADDVDRAGSIEELSKAVKASAKEISWTKLEAYAERFPNGAVKKRLGFLFEALAPTLAEEGKAVLAKWQTNLSAGVSPLVPSVAQSGRIIRRWRILVNVRV